MGSIGSGSQASNVYIIEFGYKRQCYNEVAVHKRRTWPKNITKSAFVRMMSLIFSFCSKKCNFYFVSRLVIYYVIMLAILLVV